TSPSPSTGGAVASEAFAITTSTELTCVDRFSRATLAAMSRSSTDPLRRDEISTGGVAHRTSQLVPRPWVHAATVQGPMHGPVRHASGPGQVDGQPASCGHVLGQFVDVKSGRCCHSKTDDTAA